LYYRLVSRVRLRPEQPRYVSMPLTNECRCADIEQSLLSAATPPTWRESVVYLTTRPQLLVWCCGHRQSTCQTPRLRCGFLKGYIGRTPSYVSATSVVDHVGDAFERRVQSSDPPVSPIQSLRIDEGHCAPHFTTFRHDLEHELRPKSHPFQRKAC
jgi:hypothetical protein